MNYGKKHLGFVFLGFVRKIDILIPFTGDIN